MQSAFFAILPLLAAPDAMGAAPELPPTPELPSYGGLLLRTLVALVVVLLVAWLVLRWASRRLSPAVAGAPSLRVISRVLLDGRRSVVLVEAGGRYLVLGVADGGVSLLCELPPEAVDGALTPLEAARPRRFADILRERLGRRPPPKRPPEEPQNPGEAPQ